MTIMTMIELAMPATAVPAISLVPADAPAGRTGDRPEGRDSTFRSVAVVILLRSHLIARWQPENDIRAYLTLAAGLRPQISALKNKLYRRARFSGSGIGKLHAFESVTSRWQRARPTMEFPNSDNTQVTNLLR